MPVIINDLEVIVEPTAGQPATGQAPGPNPPTLPTPPRPQDIRDVVRRQVERETRLRAH